MPGQQLLQHYALLVCHPCFPFFTCNHLLEVRVSREELASKGGDLSQSVHNALSLMDFLQDLSSNHLQVLSYTVCDTFTVSTGPTW